MSSETVTPSNATSAVAAPETETETEIKNEQTPQTTQTTQTPQTPQTTQTTTQTTQVTETNKIVAAINTFVEAAEAGRRIGAFEWKDCHEICYALEVLTNNRSDDNDYTEQKSINILIQATEIARKKGALSWSLCDRVYKAFSVLPKKPVKKHVEL